MREKTENSIRPFIAHTRKATGKEKVYIALDESGAEVSIEIQTIKEHLENTAILATGFASKFAAGQIAGQIGLMHDIGKYSEAFQKRIWENGRKCDHTSAGAQEIMRLNADPFGLIAAYCIAGHHAGLMNGGTESDSNDVVRSLKARLKKTLEGNLDYQKYMEDVQSVKLSAAKPVKYLTTLKTQHGFFSMAFWIRMLFSCLVDADFLDTEKFVNYGKNYRNAGEPLNILKEKLDKYIKEKKWLDGSQGINALRSGILQNCIEKGEKTDKNLFSLTVPTGGGKTVASLAFALNHAVSKGKDRIIYVIPYCSIIDQTVEKFNEILGEENVLAHYSEAEFEEMDDEGEDVEKNPKILATENWDKPVVVTTAVQFFESLFACRTPKCRKLHNIANAVVIFDEAQTLPKPYLKPCIAAIMELACNYRTSCVFCTATQPALDRYIGKYLVDRKPADYEIEEICQGTEELYQSFKRVTYRKLGLLTDEQLAERLSKCDQVLCIVTTRRQAEQVYHLLPQEETCHLSKCMTSEHIKSVLKTIHERLDAGKPCRVVATSLVEAGVDLDFPIVYRAKSGLDNLIQAGGRCNREGKKAAKDSIVYVFDPEEKYYKYFPDEMKFAASCMELATRDTEDIAENSVVKKYFDTIYNLSDGEGQSGEDKLDRKNIISAFEESKKMAFPFADVAKTFKLIDNDTITVFVPRDEISRKLAEKMQIKNAPMTVAEYRTIGKYCVNVYQENFKKIIQSVNVVAERLAVLAVPNLYDENTGLKFEDAGGFGLFA